MNFDLYRALDTRRPVSVRRSVEPVRDLSRRIVHAFRCQLANSHAPCPVISVRQTLASASCRKLGWELETPRIRDNNMVRPQFRFVGDMKSQWPTRWTRQRDTSLQKTGLDTQNDTAVRRRASREVSHKICISQSWWV